MKRYSIILVLLLSSQFLIAQILTFEFEGLAGNEETTGSNFNVGNIEASVISRSSELHPIAKEDMFYASFWGNANLIDLDRYMEFTITPNTGHEFSIDSIYIQMNRSSLGPQKIVLRSSVDNYNNNLDQEYTISSINKETFTFKFSQTPSNSPVVYRVFMYNASANGGNAGPGNYANTDIRVYGSVSHIAPANQIIITRNCAPATNKKPDRYAEIYNAGNTPVEMNNWTLENIQNGNYKFQWEFSGTIAAGESWVCARVDATNQTILPDVTATWVGVVGWNGTSGDGTILKNGSGDTLDYAVLPNNVNNFSDGQMKRKLSSVISNPTYNADEWVFINVADANDLLPGEHGTVFKKNILWGTTGNWDCEVPTQYTDAFIVAELNQPEIAVSASAICKDLTIASGAALTIRAKGSLTVKGTLTNNAGTAGLILKADANGGASLIHHTNGVAATVETYFELDAHYFISAPISNAQSNVFTDQYMYTWNEPNYSWDNFSETTTPLTPTQGFDVWNVNQNTVTYAGPLNNGDITTASLTRKSNPEAEEWPGYNLVGNPYSSVLDINKLVFTDIGAASYVYQHGTSGDDTHYFTWTKGTGGDPEAHYIQPGQGFFVRVAESITNATLQFTNAARVHEDLGPLDKSSIAVKPNVEVLILALQNEDKSRSDKTYIGFRDGATKDFDGYYDASKLFGGASNSYVFSYLDKDLSQKMAINAFPTPQEDEVVPLGLMINDEGDYSLNFSNMDSFEGKPVFFVKDVLLKKVYDLQEDSIILFSYYKGQPEHRFDLYFKDIEEEDALDHHFVVYVNNNRIYLYSLVEYNANTKVEIYNVIGQKVYEDVLVNIEEGLSVRWPSSYYVIRLQDGDKSYSETFFIP